MMEYLLPHSILAQANHHHIRGFRITLGSIWRGQIPGRSPLLGSPCSFLLLRLMVCLPSAGLLMTTDDVHMQYPSPLKGSALGMWSEQSRINRDNVQCGIACLLRC